MKTAVCIILVALVLSCSDMKEDQLVELPIDAQEILGSWTNDDEILLGQGDPTHYSFSFFDDGTFEGSIISFNGCPSTEEDIVCNTWVSSQRQISGNYELLNGVIELALVEGDFSNLTMNDFRKENYIVFSSDEFSEKLFKPGEYSTVNKAVNHDAIHPDVMQAIK